MKLSRVLVTGGAGFIGSWLSEALVSRGALVRVLDNFQSGVTSNVSHILDSIELIKGDVRDYKTVEKAIEDMEFIFHLAANASVPASTNDPEYDFGANALGTFNVLKAACEKGDDAVVIYASSAAVYGEPSYVPIDENHPLNPISFYGASKVAGEAYCRAFHHIRGLKTVILRLFNTYGPRQPRYVMYDLLRKLNQNPFHLQVLGTGEQKRDFTYVTDCVNAFLLAAEKPDAIGKTINIGTGFGITIKQLTNMILELLGLTGTIEVIYSGESWQGDVRELLADNRLSRELLGYDPKITVETGLKNLVMWYKSLQTSFIP